MVCVDHSSINYRVYVYTKSSLASPSQAPPGGGVNFMTKFSGGPALRATWGKLTFLPPPMGTIWVGLPHVVSQFLRHHVIDSV